MWFNAQGTALTKFAVLQSPEMMRQEMYDNKTDVYR